MHIILYTTFTMHEKNHQLSMPFRAIIVAYRVQLKLGWAQIGRYLGISPEAVQIFFNRVVKRAHDDQNACEDNDLNILLEYIEPHKPTGRPILVPPGSEAANKVRSAQLTYTGFDLHGSANHENIENVPQPLSRGTAMRIAKGKRYAEGEAEAKRKLQEAWQVNDEFNEHVRNKANVKRYYDLALMCRDHGGNNNFRA